MTYNMNKYQHMGWKALTMLFMMCLTFTGTTALTSCSSDEDPFFTVSENDDPRILNTDLADQTLDRLTKLNIEIKVTPIKYTTVTWLLDGVQIAEGTTIDQTLPIGVHVLKIVATTTVGKSTSRTLNITVTAAATDPAPAGSDIHETLVKQGTKATMHGSNISKVAKVIIGGTAVDAIYNEEDDYIEYTVPDLADGVYNLQLQDKEGNIFDVGTIELNHDPAYPVGGEVTLWTGTHAVDWGSIWADDGTITAKLKEMAKVGSILRLYCKRTADDYCQASPTVDWAHLCTGNVDHDGDGARGDTSFDGEATLEFVLTEKSMELLAAGNLQVVGHGFDLLKISIETPTETELWTGTHAVDWGTIWADDGTITAKLKEVAKVGSILRLYCKRTADDYCQASPTVDWAHLCTGNVDHDGDGARGDTSFDGEATLEFVLTEKSMELLAAGNLQVVGHGFDLLKITIE